MAALTILWMLIAGASPAKAIPHACVGDWRVVGESDGTPVEHVAAKLRSASTYDVVWEGKASEDGALIIEIPDGQQAYHLDLFMPGFSMRAIPVRCGDLLPEHTVDLYEVAMPVDSADITVMPAQYDGRSVAICGVKTSESILVVKHRPDCWAPADESGRIHEEEAGKLRVVVEASVLDRWSHVPYGKVCVDGRFAHAPEGDHVGVFTVEGAWW